MPERDISTTEWLRLKRLSEAYPETYEAPAYVPPAQLIEYSSWIQAEKFNALAEEQLRLQREYYEEEIAREKTIFTLYAEATAEAFEQWRLKAIALQDFAQHAVSLGQKIAREQEREEIMKEMRMRFDFPTLGETLGGFALGGTVSILIIVMILAIVGMGFMGIMTR